MFSLGIFIVIGAKRSPECGDPAKQGHALIKKLGKTDLVVSASPSF